jgi:alpha-L-fucosidase
MNTKRTIISTVLAATLAALNVGHAADAAGATDEQAAAKKKLANLQEDFLKLKFGMFIHYNMATYKGQEWVEGYPDPSDFNPGGKVDTDAWADAAQGVDMVIRSAQA